MRWVTSLSKSILEKFVIDKRIDAVSLPSFLAETFLFSRMYLSLDLSPRLWGFLPYVSPKVSWNTGNIARNVNLSF